MIRFIFKNLLYVLVILVITFYYGAYYQYQVSQELLEVGILAEATVVDFIENKSSTGENKGTTYAPVYDMYAQNPHVSSSSSSPSCCSSLVLSFFFFSSISFAPAGSSFVIFQATSVGGKSDVISPLRSLSFAVLCIY